jgi:hypothetical protein
MTSRTANSLSGKEICPVWNWLTELLIIGVILAALLIFLPFYLRRYLFCRPGTQQTNDIQPQE